MNRSPNMDVLVALGTTAAWGYSTYNVLTGGTHLYFESAVIIITLILLGKLLETRARGKTSAAIEMLMNLQPKTATVLRDGREEVIAAADIRKDDRVLVHPGESISVDGVVEDGPFRGGRIHAHGGKHACGEGSRRAGVRRGRSTGQAL